MEQNQQNQQRERQLAAAQQLDRLVVALAEHRVRQQPVYQSETTTVGDVLKKAQEALAAQISIIADGTVRDLIDALVAVEKGEKQDDEAKTVEAFKQEVGE